MQTYWYITDGHVANNGYTVNRVSAQTLDEARKKIGKVHRDFRIFLVDELRVCFEASTGPKMSEI